MRGFIGSWAPGRCVALLAAASATLGGCTLADVTVPAGEDRVVVEAVLRAGADRQDVLLHRTVAGTEVRGVPGARVTVREEGSGNEVVFAAAGEECFSREEGYDGSFTIGATCYRSPAAAGRWVRPGETYELRIELPAGEGTVRGRTRVPSSYGLAGLPFTAGGDADAAPSCVLPPATSLPVAWSRAEGAWGYLIGLRILGLPQALAGRGIAEVPDTLDLNGVAVSETDTTIVVPGQVGVFDRFDQDQQLLLALQDGFPAGASARFLVAAADRNYVNGVRGGRFNPSGQVRISSVTGAGAVGVFGSLAPLALRIRVAAQPEPGEGPCLGRS